MLVHQLRACEADRHTNYATSQSRRARCARRNLRGPNAYRVSKIGNMTGEGNRVAAGSRIGGMRNSKVRALTYSFSKITTSAIAFRDLLGQSRAQSAAISYQARPVNRTSATWPDIDGT